MASARPFVSNGKRALEPLSQVVAVKLDFYDDRVAVGAGFKPDQRSLIVVQLFSHRSERPCKSGAIGGYLNDPHNCPPMCSRDNVGRGATVKKILLRSGTGSGKARCRRGGKVPRRCRNV